MKFDILYIDAPWFFNQRAVHQDSPTKFGGGANATYDLMSDADILELGPYLQAVTANPGLVFSWVTGSRLDLGVDALRAWGYRYGTIFQTWVKTYPKSGEFFRGPGAYSASNVELLLVGHTGKLLPRQEKLIESIIWNKEDSVIREPHPRGEDGKIIHSAKPEEARRRIERAFVTGADKPVACLELFGRKFVDGWTVIGNAVTGNDIREDLEALALL